MALALLVALGFVAYDLLSGSPQETSATPLARTHPVASHHPRPDRQAVSTKSAPPTAKPPTLTPVIRPRMMTPVSAAALGPSGTGRGDNPHLAPLAIDHNLTTAWHTDSYTTARFGNLYRGTGLLLDMGHRVAITGARITLGSAAGAWLQLRVGTAPTLAGLHRAARAASTGAVVRLRLATPAHGRYVLIWFTRLPRDPAGTFRVSVHDIRLEGQP